MMFINTRNSFAAIAAMIARAGAVGSLSLLQDLTPMRVGPVAADKPIHDRRTSCYMPHQGQKERLRRRAQLAKAELKANRFRVMEAGNG